MVDVAAADRYAGTLVEADPWFITRQGMRLLLRTVRPDDAGRLVHFFDHLSSETRWRRFRVKADNIDAATKWSNACALVDIDNRTAGGAVLALEIDATGHETVAGVARLGRPLGEPTGPEAEAAVVVRDDYHRQGVGAELLRRMVLLAKQMGVKIIVANIEADNEPALRVFRKLGLPVVVQTHDAETEMRFTVPE